MSNAGSPTFSNALLETVLDIAVQHYVLPIDILQTSSDVGYDCIVIEVYVVACVRWHHRPTLQHPQPGHTQELQRIFKFKLIFTYNWLSQHKLPDHSELPEQTRQRKGLHKSVYLLRGVNVVARTRIQLRLVDMGQDIVCSTASIIIYWISSK